jgi:hypothetical protein
MKKKITGACLNLQCAMLQKHIGNCPLVGEEYPTSKSIIGTKKFKKLAKQVNEAVEEEIDYFHKHEKNGLEPRFPSVWGKEK